MREKNENEITHKKQKKEIVRLLVLTSLIVCLMGPLSGIYSSPQKAYANDSSTWMQMTSTAKSPTSIKLSWKSKKITCYKLYRANVKKDGNIGSYKLIARLGGDKTSYTDKNLKENQEYSYTLKGYKSNKEVYWAEAMDYTGLKCLFDEYQVPDAKRSTKAIELNFYAYGMKPDGYKIYRRSTEGGEYRCIADVKKAKTEMKYVDKKVTSGETYEYRVKCYKTVQNKKIVSKPSNSVQMSATNQIGQYEVQFTPDTSCRKYETILKITSAKGNGELSFDTMGYLLTLQKDESQDALEKEISLKLLSYSTDGRNWTKYDNKARPRLVLREEQELWLKVKSVHKEDINSIDHLGECEYYTDRIKYNNLTSELRVDLLQGNGQASVYEEAYH